MRLIANKPCSFGGRKFYIGDEIPEKLVADAKLQWKIGVITIVNDDMGDAVIAEAGAYDGVVPIAVKGIADGQNTAILARPEEIQQVFSILQMNAEDGVRAVYDVTSEQVLILLHAADSRKTIKNAAEGQAGKLSAMESPMGTQEGENGTMGSMEGAFS